MKKYKVYIEGQDLLLTERLILAKLNEYNNIHTTFLFIEDNIQGNEKNYSNKFLEELKVAESTHHSISLNNKINDIIIKNQLERGSND